MEDRTDRRQDDMEPKKAGDRREDMSRKEGDIREIRDANDNIRKSQGDDAGQRPAIDRHR